MTQINGVDQRFASFPYRELASAALDAAKSAGASYADFRFERLRNQQIAVHDRALQALVDSESVGYAVRVVVDGAWGFAASVALDAAAAAATARRAVDVAKTLSALNEDRVELAPEPAATDTYTSTFEIDPFTVPDREKIDRLLALTNGLLDSGKVDHADAWVLQVLENKYFASLDGADITQQRIRIGGDLNATKVDASGSLETMRSINPPRGAGWERFAGGYDFDRDVEQIPEHAHRETERTERRGRHLRPRPRPVAPMADASTSRSATRPNSTGRSATRRTTPVRRSPPSTSSTRSSTDRTSCT